MAKADLNEICRMLTFCHRGERYEEGFFGMKIEEGRIQALLRRLKQIMDAQPIS
ncbi:MAG: DUF6508 domain-containing protein [Nitrospinales bacterium]